MHKVFVGTPCYGGLITTEYFKSCMQLVALATSKKIDFFKVGRRAKVIMVEVLTSSATNTSALEINKLEIEVDDV